jgi:hypothetical protein
MIRSSPLVVSITLLNTCVLDWMDLSKRNGMYRCHLSFSSNIAVPNEEVVDIDEVDLICVGASKDISSVIRQMATS